MVLAVDAAEIIDFCFPVTKWIQTRPTDAELETLSEDQAALYEVFYGGEVDPLLLPEYAQELYGFIRYIRDRVHDILSADEIVDVLASGLSQDDIGRAATEDEILGMAEETFGQMLAVALGLESLGVSV